MQKNNKGVQIINEMDFNYLAKVLKSKLRGALKVFGLMDPESALLEKYPDLGGMYMNLLFGGADPVEIEQEFLNFVETNPGFKEEMTQQIEKNIFDLSPEYLKGSLELLSDIGGDEEGKAKIDDLLVRYEESGEDIKVLRTGLMDLAHEELATLSSGIAPITATHEKPTGEISGGGHKRLGESKSR